MKSKTFPVRIVLFDLLLLFVFIQEREIKDVAQPGYIGRLPCKPGRYHNFFGFCLLPYGKRDKICSHNNMTLLPQR